MAQKNELRNNCWTTFQYENELGGGGEEKRKVAIFLSKDPIDSQM